MAAAPDAGEAPAIDTGPLEQHVRGLDRGLERVDKLQVKWEAATLALDEMEKESVARSIYGKNDTMYRDLQRRVETAIRTKETLATSLSSAQESLASTQRRLETAERMATERATTALRERDLTIMHKVQQEGLFQVSLGQVFMGSVVSLSVRTGRERDAAGVQERERFKASFDGCYGRGRRTCWLAGVTGEGRQVERAHILPCENSGLDISAIVRNLHRDFVNDGVVNGLSLAHDVHAAFDRGAIVFLYSMLGSSVQSTASHTFNPDAGTFTMMVTDDSYRRKTAVPAGLRRQGSARVTFGELEGSELRLPDIPIYLAKARRRLLIAKCFAAINSAIVREGFESNRELAESHERVFSKWRESLPSFPLGLSDGSSASSSRGLPADEDADVGSSISM